MIRCIAFRHGQTDWNKNNLILGHTNIPINETGKLQALKVKEKLYNMPTPDVIFSSDLIRCVETAKIIYPGKKINKTRLLREIDFGVYDGKNCQTVRENDHFFNKILINVHHPLHLYTPFPKGESHAEAFQRLLKFLIQSDKKYNDKCIALFTHGDILKSIFKIIKSPVPEIKHGTFFLFNFDSNAMSFSNFEF